MLTEKMKSMLGKFRVLCNPVFPELFCYIRESKNKGKSSFTTLSLRRAIISKKEDQNIMSQKITSPKFLKFRMKHYRHPQRDTHLPGQLTASF